MKKFDLKITPYVSEIGKFELPIIHIEADTQKKGGKTYYLIDENAHSVENYVKHFLKDNGYHVFTGEIANFYFSMLSYNFKDSFFHKVYSGSADIVGLKKQETYIESSLQTNKINSDFLSNTRYLVNEYYSSTPKIRVFQKFFPLIEQINPQLLLKMIIFYQFIGYSTKGIPDLFIIHDDDIAFVEVKSLNDTLTKEQFAFIQFFNEMVSNNCYLIKVLPKQSRLNITRSGHDC